MGLQLLFPHVLSCTYGKALQKARKKAEKPYIDAMIFTIKHSLSFHKAWSFTEVVSVLKGELIPC